MRILALSVAPLMLAGVAFAQSFNVDIQGGTTGITPLPSTTFGAAAAQPGVWNAMDPNIGLTSMVLTDVGGTLTSVTFGRTAGTGGDFNVNNVGTSGDDEALLDDCDFPPGAATWTFSGLAAGTYDVYTYAWAPDLATYRSSVSVNGGPATCVGGTFAGVYTVGLTHALDTVTVPAGGSIAISFNAIPCVTFHTFNGMQIKCLNCVGTSSFCDGSGVGTACVACSNNGAAGNGCANSSFAAGAHLAASGNAGASAGTDTLVLTATNVTGPGLFFQASSLAASPIPFGDGELCASGGIIRLGVVFPGPPSPANTAAYPGGLTPNPIHIGGGPLVSGDIRHYQCWYRDAITFCTAATYNLTQGVTLTWGP